MNYITLNAYLKEARKNPDQNPKISAYAKIVARHRNAKYISSSTTKNLFVSFTIINKLGINPQSGFDTPLGIYAYLADEILNTIDPEYEELDELPFAGGRPFVNVFESKGTIINLSSIGQGNVMKLYKRLTDYYIEQRKKIVRKWTKERNWKEDVDYIEHIINDSSNKALFPSKPGGRLWYVTKKISEELSNYKKTAAPAEWNYLMRGIGIDGVFDTGIGIIHINEPSQAVFFHKGAITKNEIYDNKWNKNSIRRGLNKGDANVNNIQLIKRIKDRPINELKELFKYQLEEKANYEILRYLTVRNFNENTILEIQKYLMNKFINKFSDLRRAFVNFDTIRPEVIKFFYNSGRAGTLIVEVLNRKNDKDIKSILKNTINLYPKDYNGSELFYDTFKKLSYMDVFKQLDTKTKEKYFSIIDGKPVKEGPPF